MQPDRDYEAAKEFFDKTLVPYLQQRHAASISAEELKALVVGFLTASRYQRLNVTQLKAILEAVFVAMKLTDKFPSRLAPCQELPELLDRFSAEVGETTCNPNVAHA